MGIDGPPHPTSRQALGLLGPSLQSGEGSIGQLLHPWGLSGPCEVFVCPKLPEAPGLSSGWRAAA